MIKYLRYSDVAVRVSINPFSWVWKPAFAHDKPTAFYPKRHTFVIAFLFIQLFVDVDNGTTDFKAYRDKFFSMMDAANDDELDNTLSTTSKRDIDLV